MISLYGAKFTSRLLLGTARFPSPKILEDSLKAANTEIVTVSLRRENPGQVSGNRFFEFLKKLNLRVLPNTAGCLSVKEAITTAHMAREVFNTKWIKLEVIGNDETLLPDPFKTVEAAKILLSEGFEVFPYSTYDLIVAEKLRDLGCKVVMPLASPIGSGKGILNPFALEILRKRLPDTVLLVDAGIGRPSDAVKAMELGFDGVLLNTAVSLSHDPVGMAEAFHLAVKSGRIAYKSGIIPRQDRAQPSTPTIGLPFLQDDIQQ